MFVYLYMSALFVREPKQLGAFVEIYKKIFVLESVIFISNILIQWGIGFCEKYFVLRMCGCSMLYVCWTGGLCCSVVTQDKYIMCLSIKRLD